MHNPLLKDGFANAATRTILTYMLYSKKIKNHEGNPLGEAVALGLARG